MPLARPQFCAGAAVWLTPDSKRLLAMSIAAVTAAASAPCLLPTKFTTSSFLNLWGANEGVGVGWGVREL